MKRRILAQAARDLAGIEAYISQDNPEAAADVARRLRKSLGLNGDSGWKLEGVYQHGYRLARGSRAAAGQGA